jgi:hypothetical protein
MPFAKLAAFLSPGPNEDTHSEEDNGADPLGFHWLQTMLQTAMEHVMAGEGTPLQKASTIARLGNLYLKTCGVAELRQANRELTRRVAALEKHLGSGEYVDDASEAPPASAAKQAPTVGQSSAVPLEGSREQVVTARRQPASHAARTHHSRKRRTSARPRSGARGRPAAGRCCSSSERRPSTGSSRRRSDPSCTRSEAWRSSERSRPRSRPGRCAERGPTRSRATPHGRTAPRGTVPTPRRGPTRTHPEG